MSAETTTELGIPAVRKVAAANPARTELLFRRGLWVVSAITAILLLASAAVMLWAQNEFAPPESVVSAHAQMLAHDGTLYYGLADYPYTVSAYMPMFYWLEAGLVSLGLPALMGGRLITFAALAGLILVCGRVTLLYSRQPLSAWIASILVAASPLMIFWGAVAQVDILAVCFAMTAFYYYSRFEVDGEATLLLAGLCAGLALFTKQTMIAAPAAITLSLWLRGHRALALKFAAGFGAGMAALVFGINAALEGRFLANTVFANMNPMSWEKFLAQAQYLGGVSAGLMVIVAASVQRLRGKTSAVVVYAACALGVFLLTAPKIGSDTNYQLELTAILAVTAAVGLQELDFFGHYFQGSKSWVTLLLLPLGVHVMVGARVGVNMLLSRVATEQVFRAQIAGLRPYLQPSGDRVLSTDFNAVARLRGRMDVEPLIYGLLVARGRIDPEPVRRDLERGVLSTVLLDRDVFAPADAAQQNDVARLERGSLAESQLDQVRQHYRLVDHVPGPYGELFVYQPRSRESQERGEMRQAMQGSSKGKGL